MPKITDEELNNFNNLKGEVPRLKSQISECEANIKIKEAEILSRGEKLGELTNELNNLKTKTGVSSKELENANQKIRDIEAQIAKLEKEKETMAEKNQKLVVNLENLTNSFGTLSVSFDTLNEELTDNKHRLTKKEEEITNLANKFREMNEKVFEITEEKEKILKEKMDFMETNMTEKMNLSNKLSMLERDHAEAKDKIKKLKTKVRSSGDGLLGSSMEIEKLKSEIDEKERQISAVEEQIEGITTGETGIITDRETLDTYFEKTIATATRSVRIIVPHLSYLKDSGILDKLLELRENIIINIAAPITANEEIEMEIVEDLKKRGAIIANTTEKHIIALSVNGANIALGVMEESGDRVKGMFTTIAEMINLLQAALMTPFVKSTKL